MNILDILSDCCGWIYFVLWSISFYFQPWINWRRKSVVGFSFDYLLLNIVGFSTYSVYNGLMYFSPGCRNLYEDKYNSSVPVQATDVAFAFHALILTLIQTSQCFIYDRGTERVAYWNLVFSLFCVCALFGLSVLASFGILGWIFVLQCFGLTKALVSFVKYTPQAYLNFRRRCTIGFSVQNVWCDFGGGLFSFLQMTILAIRHLSISQLVGNPGKFALSVESQFFDTVFLVQHYILYRGNTIDRRTGLSAIRGEEVLDAGLQPDEHEEEPAAPTVETLDV